jgi:hypothetical protein
VDKDFHGRRIAGIFHVLLDDFARYDETGDPAFLGRIRAELRAYGPAHIKKFLFGEISGRPDDRANLIYRKMLAAVIRLGQKKKKRGAKKPPLSP